MIDLSEAIEIDPQYVRRIDCGRLVIKAAPSPDDAQGTWRVAGRLFPLGVFPEYIYVYDDLYKLLNAGENFFTLEVVACYEPDPMG